ncbi:hypothetical protein BJV38_004786 [Clostridium beijerinckii]|uniref:hypothetical protein n=1 Tax=Clostridium beijerinckii TaxID=1520 RepID=UPI00156F5C6F|nr:hypothetical protein [Clostridium beijerinckii]NRT32629.1 hypothetical protein [Clostridium beijerinckii]NRT47943.1 hypothetical protein [Clostridium beijerinckii]NRZ23761.1 hypothetical protein [Clostridium beijerinckii]
MSNKEEIAKLVKGELTYTEAYELENKLHIRSNREIIEDLKQLNFQSLLTTEESLENFLDTMSELENTKENKSTIESCKRSLEFLEIAISERIDDMLSAEKKLKDILCNC